MFARRYFAGRYFAPRYWSESQGEVPVNIWFIGTTWSASSPAATFLAKSPTVTYRVRGA